MRQLSHLIITASTATVVLAGCTTTITPGDATRASSTTASTAQTSPTVTSTLPGPHPSANENNDGTSFDPCVAYTSDELKAWGVAPGSVEDKGVKDTVQRGCQWKGDGWVLQQLVVNRTLNEYLDQQRFPGSEAITVGGLNAVRFRSPPDDQTVCFVVLPSQRATVGTIVRVNDPQAQRSIPDPCVKAMAIATDSARKLPK